MCVCIRWRKKGGQGQTDKQKRDSKTTTSQLGLLLCGPPSKWDNFSQRWKWGKWFFIMNSWLRRFSGRLSKKGGWCLSAGVCRTHCKWRRPRGEMRCNSKKLGILKFSLKLIFHNVVGFPNWLESMWCGLRNYICNMSKWMNIHFCQPWKKRSSYPIQSVAQEKGYLFDTALISWLRVRGKSRWESAHGVRILSGRINNNN